MTTKAFMEKLDDLCFDKVLERDGDECIICKLVGKVAKSPLHPHHAWSRSYKYIRWDLWNIYPVCESHHLYGIHSNRTLTEDLFRAIIAVMYPERYETITKLKGAFFDVSMPKLIEKKREVSGIEFYFKGATDE